MGFSDGSSSVLGVKRPSVPPFGKNRYLDNQTHMVSANSIVRLRGDLNLRANVQYQHDLREDEGTSVTTYHLADPAQQIVIGESILSRSRLDRCPSAARGARTTAAWTTTAPPWSSPSAILV